MSDGYLAALRGDRMGGLEPALPGLGDGYVHGTAPPSPGVVPM